MDLASLFTPSTEERVGIELECGLVDPETGRSVGYDGPRSAQRFLSAVCHEFGTAPVTEAGALVGAQLPGGAQLSLELGGAMEYSSAPYRSLTDLVAATRRDVTAVAEVAARAGVALLPGGLLPFTPVAQIPWIPKARIRVMRQYFRSLGPAGAAGENVMGLSLSAQTTVDYLSAADFAEKLRLLVRIAPVAAAMFVNSPLEDGQATCVLSRRMQLWTQVDPARCGILGFAVKPGTAGVAGAADVSVDDVVRWALSLPMIYRYDGSAYVPAPSRPFGDLIRDGYGDGTAPSLADWHSHLSQTWPHVRPRQTLEMRALDCPPWGAFAAAPALCVGLAYHPPSRRAALSLLGDVSAADLERAWEEIAAKGLNALVGRHSVGATAETLLRLARQGLLARVASGVEAPEVVSLLDPLDEVVRTGVTFAERYANDWLGPLRERPAALVRAYRIDPGQDGV